MTLAVWKPKGKNKDCVRKGYTANEKLKRDWAYLWDCESGIKNGEADLNKIARLVTSIREKNANVCLANAFPIQKYGFRRNYESLEDVGTDILYLDFDGDDASVTKESNLLERVNKSLSMLPSLRDASHLGLVAFYSSSAYWRKERPSRISVHCIIILDKVYPHRDIEAWQKQYKDVLDPATTLRSQPLLIANPDFYDSHPRKVVGDEILVRQGKRLKLPKIDSNIHEIRPDTLKLRPEVYSKDIDDWKKQALAKAEAGELDGRRQEFIFNTFHTKIFHERENIDAYLKVFEDNPILYTNPETQDRTFKDVIRTRLRVQKMVDDRLLGKAIERNKNFKTKTVHTKTLGKDDIADFPTEAALILVKSGCNTRKTTGIIDNYLEMGGFNSGIFLSPNKAQLEAFVNRENKHKWRMYNEMGGGVAEKMDWMPKQKWLASTDQSIGYFFKQNSKGEDVYPFEDEPPEIVIFEEAEACSMNLINPRSQQNAPLIYDMCEHAKAILMLDGDITDDLTGYVAQSLAKQTRKEPWLLHNTFNFNSEKKIQLLKSEAQAILTIKALLDVGDRVFCHVGYNDDDEKKRISALVAHFQKELGNPNAVKGFSAKSAPAELRRNPNVVIQKWLDDGLRLLIHSPWSIRSWDYNPHHLNATHFDANVGIYPRMNISPNDINQQDWRMRQTRKSFIYITPERNYKQFESTERNISKGALTVKRDDLSHQVWQKAKNRNNDAKANIRDAYKLLVERQGATVSTEFLEEPWHDEYEKKLTKILNSHQRDEFDQECRALWDKPHSRDSILDQFFDIRLAEREFDGEIQPNSLNRSDINYEDFKELVKRSKRIKPSEVRDIIACWRMSESERKELDLEESARCATLKGLIGDAINRELEDYFPKGITILPEIVALDRDGGWLTVTDQAKTTIGNVIKSYYSSAHDEIPWLIPAHKKQYLGFIEGMFDYFEIKWERVDKTSDVALKKREIIKEYELLDLIHPKDPQKTKLPIINSNISRKIRNNEKLSYKERAWQLARGTNYLLSFPEFRNKTIFNEAKRGVSYA